METEANMNNQITKVTGEITEKIEEQSIGTNSTINNELNLKNDGKMTDENIEEKSELEIQKHENSILQDINLNLKKQIELYNEIESLKRIELRLEENYCKKEYITRGNRRKSSSLKLDPQIINRIKELLEKGYTPLKIARLLKIGVSTVYKYK